MGDHLGHRFQSVHGFFLYFAPQSVSIFVIVAVGQAHFFQTYWRSSLSRPISRRQILFLCGLGLILGTLVANFEITDLLIFLVGSYFVLHLYFDDLHLRSETSSHQSSILELFAFFSIFTSTTLVRHLHAPAQIISLGLALSLGFVLALIFRVVRQQYKVTQTGALLLLWTILAAIAFWADFRFLLFNLWGLIVPYHYFHWYYAYFLKLKKQNRPVRPYLFETFSFLIPHLILGGLYTFGGPDFALLKFLYRLDYFSIWTLLHLLFTNRKESWRVFNFKREGVELVV